MDKTRDKGGSFEILLTDLANAFDCFLHDSLIAVFRTYGFDMP